MSWKNNVADDITIISITASNFIIYFIFQIFEFILKNLNIPRIQW